MNRMTEERTPTMIRASSTGLNSEPNGKLKDAKNTATMRATRGWKKNQARSAKFLEKSREKIGV
jgi:hypothetical protein